MLLDFVYGVNEWLLERDWCRFVLVGLTALFIVASCVGAGFLYKVWRGLRRWPRWSGHRHFSPQLGAGKSGWRVAWRSRAAPTAAAALAVLLALR